MFKRLHSRTGEEFRLDDVQPKGVSWFKGDVAQGTPPPKKTNKQTNKQTNKSKTKHDNPPVLSFEERVK